MSTVPTYLRDRFDGIASQHGSALAEQVERVLMPRSQNPSFVLLILSFPQYGLELQSLSNSHGHLVSKMEVLVDENLHAISREIVSCPAAKETSKVTC